MDWMIFTWSLVIQEQLQIWKNVEKTRTLAGKDRFLLPHCFVTKQALSKTHAKFCFIRLPAPTMTPRYFTGALWTRTPATDVGIF